jgi:hypothetical protein
MSVYIAIHTPLGFLRFLSENKEDTAEGTGAVVLPLHNQAMVLHLERNKLHLPHINYSRTHKQYFTISVAIRTSYSFLLLRATLTFPSPGGNRIQILAFTYKGLNSVSSRDISCSSCQW